MHQQQCGLACAVQVFDNDEFPPDAEFGCFQVVMGPLDTDFANDALIRLDVGKFNLLSVLKQLICDGLMVVLVVTDSKGHGVCAFIYALSFMQLHLCN